MVSQQVWDENTHRENEKHVLLAYLFSTNEKVGVR